MAKRLDLPDAGKGSYEPVVDPERQWAVPGENSPRHRVRNNLPGTPEFCPLVFRTQALEEFVAMDLGRRAQEVVAKVPKDILARTAAFLLLKDSRSSYAIEGERPPQDRIQRWGRAIGEAGRRSIELDELLRLQAIVIGDARFCAAGPSRRRRIRRRTRSRHSPSDSRPYQRPAGRPAVADRRHGRFRSWSGSEPGCGDRRRRAGLRLRLCPSVCGWQWPYPRYLIHHVLARRGSIRPALRFRYRPQSWRESTSTVPLWRTIPGVFSP